jgi:hypothetical protein
VAYWHVLDEATGVRDGKQRLKALIRELDQAGYQAAARCLADDLDALVVHLRYPLRHRRRWRSTNLLERSLCEVRRRTKVIGRFPGETSCLSLVWAVLDLFITHASNGANFTDLDRKQLYQLRYQPAEKPTPQEVTAYKLTATREPEPRRIYGSKGGAPSSCGRQRLPHRRLNPSALFSSRRSTYRCPGRLRRIGWSPSSCA